MQQHPKRRFALKDLLRDERGIVAIYTAICLPVFVGFLILVADGSHALSTRHLLQVTADSAALAAAGTLNKNPTASALATTAQTFAALNMPSSSYGSVLAASDVSLRYWPGVICNSQTPCDQTCNNNAGTLTPCNAVKVTTRTTPKLVFFQALGWTGFNENATAIATYGYGSTNNDPTTPTWNTVIAQDISGSFKDSISFAQTADQFLLDCMKNNAPPRSQFGLTLFVDHSVERPALTPLVNPTSGRDNYQTLKNSISGFSDCGGPGMPTNCTTNIAAAIQDGVTQFTSPAFTQSLAPNSVQNIVIVTDGEPNTCGVGNNCGTAAAEALSTTWANNAAAKNINVYTIYYCVPSSNSCTPAAKTFLASLVRGNGFAQVSPTQDELAKSMVQVCANQITRLVW
jgi:Flp pilus assembly protein TadG